MFEFNEEKKVILTEQVQINKAKIEALEGDISSLEQQIDGIDVPNEQTTLSIVQDALTNINGWVLTRFSATLTSAYGYDVYQIKLDGEDDILSEEDAIKYMEDMTGSKFLPKYDYFKPQNSFLVFADKTLWKPQYDDVNGLLLFKVADLMPRVYKPMGSQSVSDLNELTGTSTNLSSLYGEVYNVTDSGTLNNYTGTTSVIAGDNVVFIYVSDTDWYWDNLAGIVDLSNYVTLNGNQTITGSKTFSSSPYISNGVYLKSKTTNNSDCNIIGLTTGNNVALNQTSTGSVLCYSTFRPAGTGNKDLGTSGQTWHNIYLDGVLSDGTNSISVADIENKNNKVTSLSASSTDTQYPSAKSVYDALTLKANDADVVKKAGSQTISGTKTFSIDPILNNNIYLLGTKSNGTTFALIGMRSDGAVKVGNVFSALILDTSSVVIPSANETKSLGNSSYKWKDLYLSGNLSDGTNSISVANIENKNNKVTSLSGSSTDAQYPSAKCVYDYVGNSKELYYCTYGTTTFAEVAQAISDGKLPVCIYPGANDVKIHLVCSYFTGADYYFSCSMPAATYSVYLTQNSNWSQLQEEFCEKESNKVTSISSASTDDQYPSAKCVYNAIPKNTSDLVNDSGFITGIPAPQAATPAVSASDKFTFTGMTFDSMGIFSFGDCNTFINLYGLQIGVTYKQAGTFIFDSGGSVVTTTINVKRTSDSVLEISSGNTNYSFVNGYTGYIYKIKLG